MAEVIIFIDQDTISEEELMEGDSYEYEYESES